MVRDLEKEQLKIKNGNRYIMDDSGSGVFARDYDRLLLEYTNLRRKLYNQHKDAFNDSYMQDELKSYIDEQFVKLVKEYEINAPVDFPGYIKKKLGLRVSKSFMKSKFRDMAREQIPREEETIDILLDNEPYIPEDLVGAEELFNYIFQDREQFTNIELDIIQLMLSEKYTTTQLIREVADRYGRSIRDVDKIVTDIREYVRYKLEKYNEE